MQPLSYSRAYPRPRISFQLLSSVHMWFFCQIGCQKFDDVSSAQPFCHIYRVCVHTSSCLQKALRALISMIIFISKSISVSKSISLSKSISHDHDHDLHHPTHHHWPHDHHSRHLTDIMIAAPNSQEKWRYKSPSLVLTHSPDHQI